ncbi:MULTISPECIES: YdeI/OmpD-associated family protein [Lacticaseibacillus]|uniref:YdeI/OmpD-associated family protein n=1 Tax=Lacticaseibacillus TaxID=2759736 RepID=UPI00063DCEB6|nr:MULTISPECIES: YdeI/OmpD-associated family protein [Lacticaseibacillus]KLI75488.1 thymidylate synthase [Lacticaseibacillus casei]
MVKKIVNHLTVTNRQQFRKWLATHYQDATECWVDVKRGVPKPDGTFWYVDAVEEAMCFGWIDSTYKKLAPDQPASQRFVPRQSGSVWPELNKERCRRMIHLGRMTPAGYAVLPNMDPNSFKIDASFVRALIRRPGAWAYFQSCPALYQRVRCDTIQIKRNQPKLFRQRLTKFANACQAHRMIGQWNDGGRLPVSDV